MPEAAMNENHRPARAHYNVGLSRQIFCVQCIPATKTMERPPHPKLGAGILGAYPRHQPRTAFRTELIDHLFRRLDQLRRLHVQGCCNALKKHPRDDR